MHRGLKMFVQLELPFCQMLTSSAGVFPAKTCPSQERARGSRASAPASGSNTNESFARWDRDSSSWKTSPRSGQEDSTLFSERWPRSGTMRNGKAFELLTSEPRTAESVSSSWPTPSAGLFNDGESVESWEARRERVKATGVNGNGMGMPLGIAVKIRPTPTVTGLWNRAGMRPTSGDGLSTAVKNWATPTSRDWKDGVDPSPNAPTNGLLGRQAPRENGGGALNPDWVETLMGFPIGWTDGLPVPEKRKRNGNRRGR